MSPSVHINLREDMVLIRAPSASAGFVTRSRTLRAVIGVAHSRTIIQVVMAWPAQRPEPDESEGESASRVEL